MKSFLLKSFAAALMVGLIFTASSSYAESTLTNSFTYTPNMEIPDNESTGASDTQIISSPIQVLSGLRVSLQIDGGYNGDLYAFLTHNSGFTILLNRVGKTVDNPFGYADSGFDVTFTSSAVNDIHNYQNVYNPNGNSLIGEWQPDARTADPDDVLDTSPRLVGFSSFTGLNPNGSWTLFLADGSSVGISTLNTWSLDIIGVVPEPSTYALFGISAMALCFGLRRQK